MPDQPQHDRQTRERQARVTTNRVELPPAEAASGPNATKLLYLDLAAAGPLPKLDELSEAAKKTKSPAAPRTFWLDGDALMCACPDCSAPMSVRLWLMMADCWRCGASIALSEEQEREVLALLEQQQAGEHIAAAAPTPSPRASERAAPLPPISSGAAGSAVTARNDSPHSRVSRPATGLLENAVAGAMASAAQETPAPALAPAVQLSAIGTTGVWLREAFRDMPAWLVSLIFHLMLLTLLGILSFGREEDRTIVLSTTVNSFLRTPGESLLAKPQEEVVFDLPVPDKFDQSNQRQREAMVRADQDAREIRMDPQAVSAQLPDLAKVKEAIGRGGTSLTPLIARDPRVRVEMVKAEGGTTLTEASVSRGLRWLSKNQYRDGRWRLEVLPFADGGEGQTRSDTAATSLALLPFLGAGQTHLVGQYKDHVSAGLRWLIEQQASDGDLRGDSEGTSGMYAHGQAAIVLCEAFAMTRDEALRESAQKAIDFIVAAQHPAGGWRYRPGEAGDTSVFGWQLMALQSGRAAGLNVPPETLEIAGHFLDSVSNEGNGYYAYQRGREPTPIMTAEALLCRIYLGWRKDEPGLTTGVSWLVDQNPPDRRNANIYYWYYATQTIHHYGGPKWNTWNKQMRDVLVNTQEKTGRNAGSWDPVGPHTAPGGRLYITALAVCTLEVYYRHLPVFKQLEIE